MTGFKMATKFHLLHSFLGICCWQSKWLLHFICNWAWRFRKCTFPHDLENRMCDYFHLFAIYHHVPGSAIFRLMAAIKSKFRMYLPELHYYAPKHSIQTIWLLLLRKVLSHHVWSNYKFPPLDYIELWRHEFELCVTRKMATCLFCLSFPNQTADHIQCWIRIIILFRKTNRERIFNVWNRRLT